MVGIHSIDFVGVQLWEAFGFLVSYYLNINLLLSVRYCSCGARSIHNTTPPDESYHACAGDLEDILHAMRLFDVEHGVVTDAEFYKRIAEEYNLRN